MSKIFIQIASYRDPQLVPTLNSLFENAANPQNLKICIAWQKDDIESIGKYENHNQVELIPIPYNESKGACWARNLIQQRYNNEEYTLQIDSHMRFGHNWDKEFIKMLDDLQDLCYDKPALTGYVSSFDPDYDPQSRILVPWKMKFDRFIPEGAVFFLPESIDEFQILHRPVPARFYSAHFCFTLGSFVREVPHDPEYYFHGEEISIGVRGFTHGYDFFHPHKALVWHEYTRKGRTKHWDDHVDGKPIEKAWWVRNEESHKRNRILFGMEEGNVDFGPYGFGKVRTLQDYEAFAGINFKLRLAHPFTSDNIDYPPTPEPIRSEQEWKNKCIKQYNTFIDINADVVNPNEEYSFWYVGIHDKNGQELYRKDLDSIEIEDIILRRRWRISYPFNTNQIPSTYTVWFHSKDKGWLHKFTKNVELY